MTSQKKRPFRNRLNELEPKEWLKFQKSWFVHNPPPRKKGVLRHPAKFPESLAQEFIEFFTKAGQTVLDPMVGTGSTLVACLRAGRHSYGVELNAAYADIARQVVAEERETLGEVTGSLAAEVICGDASRMAEHVAAHQIPPIDYVLTCYDDQTEILTEDGWVPFPQLGEGTKVATLEEGRFLRYREPVRIIQAPYDGPMYHIRTRTIDLMVTPNHNMYVRKRRSKSGFQLIPACQIIGKEVEYKIDAEWEGEERTTLVNPRTQAHEEITGYQGMVYCVQVPSGIIYVRRSGKGIWSGNSPPYWDMLRMRGAATQKKRRSDPDLDLYYSNDPRDLGNLTDYDQFLDQLCQIYEALHPLLKEKAYLTIIAKNVKKGGKIYPLAWDIGKRLERTYTLKDERIWLQDNIRLAPYGMGNAWVSNTFHHYCLQFRKE